MEGGRPRKGNGRDGRQKAMKGREMGRKWKRIRRMKGGKRK